MQSQPFDSWLGISKRDCYHRMHSSVTASMKVYAEYGKICGYIFALVKQAVEASPCKLNGNPLCSHNDFLGT